MSDFINVFVRWWMKFRVAGGVVLVLILVVILIFIVPYAVSWLFKFIRDEIKDRWARKRAERFVRDEKEYRSRTADREAILADIGREKLYGRRDEETERQPEHWPTEYFSMEEITRAAGEITARNPAAEPIFAALMIRLKYGTEPDAERDKRDGEDET